MKRLALALAIATVLVVGCGTDRPPVQTPGPVVRTGIRFQWRADDAGVYVLTDTATGACWIGYFGNIAPAPKEVCEAK